MKDPATLELLNRWVGGDGDAAEEIFRRYHQRVERYAMTLMKDTGLAAELTSDSFAEALEGAKQGRKPRRFDAWLAGICKNLARARHRDENNALVDLPSSAAGEGPGPRTVSIREEMAEVLRAALDEIAPTSKEVIELHIHEGLNRDEIARRLGLNRETIDRRFGRGYESLRRRIREHVTSILMPACPGKKRISWEQVEALRPSFRQALILRHLENHPLEEAARRMGVPAGTLKARLRAAYKQVPCGPGDDFEPAREGYLHSRRQRVDRTVQTPEG